MSAGASGITASWCRVAHHEPVHRRDLLADLQAAVDLVAWVCPDSAAWLSATSSVSEVMRRRPDG